MVVVGMESCGYCRSAKVFEGSYKFRECLLRVSEWHLSVRQVRFGHTILTTTNVLHDELDSHVTKVGWWPYNYTTNGGRLLRWFMLDLGMRIWPNRSSVLRSSWRRIKQISFGFEWTTALKVDLQGRGHL